MSEATIRIMSPEEITARAGGETKFLELPRRLDVFADRALRARQLAAGHPMRDFLVFVADIADQQHALLQSFPEIRLPDAEPLARAAKDAVAPVTATDWPRDPAWREGLRRIVDGLRSRPLPGQAAETLAALAHAPDDWLERQADRLLNGVMIGLDLGAAPVLAAALQAYWTQLVLEVQRVHGDARPAPFGRTRDARRCPCCASRPTASITRLDADTSGQRYLHCSLCSAEWHMVRIHCAGCGGNQHIAYQALEPNEGTTLPATGAAPGAVQAETCDDCGQYLKIVHMVKDPQVDPVADDLASVALDLLVAETGKQRLGVNLMLLFGDAVAEADADPGGT